MQFVASLIEGVNSWKTTAGFHVNTVAVFMHSVRNHTWKPAECAYNRADHARSATNHADKPAEYARSVRNPAHKPEGHTWSATDHADKAAECADFLRNHTRKLREYVQKAAAWKGSPGASFLRWPDLYCGTRPSFV